MRSWPQLRIIIIIIIIIIIMYVIRTYLIFYADVLFESNFHSNNVIL